jgi:predicted DNA-binding protein (MmcQ/YjbR family)
MSEGWLAMFDDKVQEQVRRICLALPEAREQETWDAPTFRVRNKIFAMLHLVDGRQTIWMKSNADERDARVVNDPNRFFAPPYLGGRGWLGVRLDGAVDWDDLTDAITESYLLIAPKRLGALVNQPR